MNTLDLIQKVFLSLFKLIAILTFLFVILKLPISLAELTGNHYWLLLYYPYLVIGIFLTSLFVNSK